MADIELVIKIPEEEYKNAKLINWANIRPEQVDDWDYVIANGTPLPKGHGRIVDIGPYEGKVIASRKYFGVDKLVEVAELDTIIEADKEYKDGQNTIKD